MRQGIEIAGNERRPSTTSFGTDQGIPGEHTDLQELKFCPTAGTVQVGNPNGMASGGPEAVLGALAGEGGGEVPDLRDRGAERFASVVREGRSALPATGPT